MNRRVTFTALAASALLAACVASPPVTPSPSPTATAPAASSAPSVAPTAEGGSPSPAAPSAAPSAAGIQWNAGTMLHSYDFNQVGGIFFNPQLNQLVVLDADSDTTTTRRFLARKFKPDGTYVSSVALALEGKQAPDAIDGMTFDAAGTPIFASRNAGAFSLQKLLTSTVVVADRYPVFAAEWAGPAALASQGVLLNTAVLYLDPEKRDEERRQGLTPSMTGGKIYFGVGEEDEPPVALFQIADPFVPTRAMAFSTTGDLYLAGQTASGGFGLKRMKRDQSVADVASLPSRPTAMWADREGGLYLADDPVGGPAHLSHLDASGHLGEPVELRLKDGGFLNKLEGLTFDAQGRAIVTGAGFDAANHSLSGMFVFSL